MICALAGAAAAKLPAPSPEQQQAAAAKKDQEQAQLEREKKQLEQAQDRVIQHYKRTKGSAAAGASTAAGGKVEDRNMPKTTKELPGSAGPRGGTAQSAEAHSAPAK
ncbi:MAG: hypothetical protein ACXWUI_13180 [Burkholderiales bacterium]